MEVHEIGDDAGGSSAIIKDNETTILIDTPKDIKSKLSGNKVGDLDAIFLSTINEEGIESLTEWYRDNELEKPIPTYMTKSMLEKLSKEVTNTSALDYTVISPNSDTPIDNIDVHAEGVRQDGIPLLKLSYIISCGGEKKLYNPHGLTEEDVTDDEYSNIIHGISQDIRETELMSQAFGSPGGKAAIAKRIVSLIPEHTTYVEAFTGGGAVYFKKKPSSREVLNDRDSRIANCYLFLRDGSEQDFDKVEKNIGKGVSKKQFFKIKDELDGDKYNKPSVDSFLKFFRLNYFSFGYKRNSYGYLTRRPTLNKKQMLRLKERLKDTKIHIKDAIEVIKEYDSESTFFYLDPPYPENWVGGKAKGAEEKYSMQDFKNLVDLLKQVKGKFLLSINNSSEVKKVIGDGLRIKKIKTRRSMESRKDKQKKKQEYELLVSNYELEKTNTFSLSQDGVFEVVDTNNPDVITLVNDFMVKENEGYTIRIGENTKHLKNKIKKEMNLLNEFELNYEPMGSVDEIGIESEYQLALIKTSFLKENFMEGDDDESNLERCGG